MKRDYLRRRMDELEQRQARQGSKATVFHEAFAAAGLPAPEPAHGEDGCDYLERVPTESLAALLEARKATNPKGCTGAPLNG